MKFLIAVFLTLRLSIAFAEDQCPVFFGKFHDIGSEHAIVRLNNDHIYVGYDQKAKQLNLFNAATKKTKTIELPDAYDLMGFSGDDLIFRSTDYTTTPYSFEFYTLNHKTEELEDLFSTKLGDIVMTSADSQRAEGQTIYQEIGKDLKTGNFVFSKRDSSELTILNPSTKQETNISLPFPPRSIVSSGAENVLVLGANRKFLLVNLRTKSVQEISEPLNEMGRLNGSHIFYFSEELNRATQKQKVAYVDLATGHITSTELTSKPLNSLEKIQFSNSGIYRVVPADALAGVDAKLMRVNPTTGTEEVFDTLKPGEWLTSVPSTSANNPNVAYWKLADQNHNQIMRVKNSKTNTLIDLPIRVGTLGIAPTISEDGQKIYLLSKEGDRTFLNVHDLKAGTVQSGLLPGVAKKNITSFKVSRGVINLSTDRGEAVSLSVSDFESQSTKTKIAAVTKNAPSSHEDLLEALKKNNVLTARDWKLIESFFAEGKYKSDPDLARALLYQMHIDSPVTYRSFLEKYPDLEKSLEKTSMDFSVFPSAKLKKWAKAMVPDLNKSISDLAAKLPYISYPGYENSLDDFFLKLSFYKPLLGSLEDETRGEMISRITNIIGENAQSKLNLQNVPLPTINKFVGQNVKYLFGGKPRALTELHLIRGDRGSISPIVLGVEAIDHDPATKTKYGFYMKSYPLTRLTNQPAGASLGDMNLRWKQMGKDFHAQVKLKAGTPLSELIERGESPDYPAMWKDKKLTGLIVPGENMAGHNDEHVMYNYIEYFEEAGFKFSKPKVVNDFHAFVEGKISDGSLDYFVKEEHSGGPNSSIARLNTKGEVAMGTKTLPDGRKEIAYVFLPDTKSPTQLVSNESFGQWMRSREKNIEAGPILYMDTTCFRLKSACYPIQAAKTKKLTVIGSPNMLDTFTNDPNTSLYQLISGIREGKSYPQIREAMAKDATYAGGTSNTYILPDEQKYMNYLGGGEMPLEVEATTFGPDGKPYAIDRSDAYDPATLETLPVSATDYSFHAPATNAPASNTGVP